MARRKRCVWGHTTSKKICFTKPGDLLSPFSMRRLWTRRLRHCFILTKRSGLSRPNCNFGRFLSAVIRLVAAADSGASRHSQ